MALRRHVLYVWLLCVPLQAYAQGGLVARPPVAPEYLLGSGDAIVLHVVDMEDEIPEKPVTIDPNGFVDIPLAGRFQASGLTLNQFKDEVASRITKYIRNPRISVNLTDQKSRVVSIIGSVSSPGRHELPGPEQLLDVLALAGGTKPDAGARVILTREQKWGKIPLPNATVDPTTGSSTAWLSLDDLQASKHPSDNILVLPNDIISIPRAEIVYVLGDVHKVGGFQLSSHPTITLLQALSLAEGPNHDAALGKSKIIRPPPNGDGKPIEIPVNIVEVLAGTIPAIPLQGNDLLYIPTNSTAGLKRAAAALLQVAAGAAVYRF
jgi:polysaccharide export outer membrane protein